MNLSNASGQIAAIDVHAHFGTYLRHGRPLQNELMSGSVNEVIDLARRSRTEVSIASPLSALLPRGEADVVAGNDEAFRIVASLPELRQYVVVHPLVPGSFAQAERMLASPQCMGIKIHPEEHCYPIREHGRAIFEFAARMNATILTHSGEERSIPLDFIPFADDFPNVTLILAHLGCGYDGDLSHQVRAVQASKKGNVFTDTSSASSINNNLIEWGVRELGAERLLFGTDTPLYFAPAQRARIDHADIMDSEKRLILRDNALRLFPRIEAQLKGETV